MQRANNSITVPKGYAIFIVGNDGEIGSLMPFNAITCDLPTIGGYEGLYKVVKIEWPQNVSRGDYEWII